MKRWLTAFVLLLAIAAWIWHKWVPRKMDMLEPFAEVSKEASSKIDSASEQNAKDKITEQAQNVGKARAPVLPSLSEVDHNAIVSANREWIGALERATLDSDYQYDVAPGAPAFAHQCARGLLRNRQDIEKKVQNLVTRQIVSDTPEVRYSIAFVDNVAIDACAQLGEARAAKIATQLADVRRHLGPIIFDLIYGVHSSSDRRKPLTENSGEPDLATARKILLAHESPSAVAIALGAMKSSPESLVGLGFFDAGLAIPGIYERAQLLPFVGSLLVCEERPSDCAPYSWNTIGYCSTTFTCGPGRDLKWLVSSRLSAIEMQAVNAMVVELANTRRAAKK